MREEDRSCPQSKGKRVSFLDGFNDIDIGTAVGFEDKKGEQSHCSSASNQNSFLRQRGEFAHSFCCITRQNDQNGEGIRNTVGDNDHFCFWDNCMRTMSVKGNDAVTGVNRLDVGTTSQDEPNTFIACHSWIAQGTACP